MPNHHNPDDDTRWRRQSAALDELLDLDATAQAARLADIEAGDPAFAAELRALLAAEAGDGPLDTELGALPREALDHAAAADESAHFDDQDEIGNWRIGRQIGRGGMGEVFLAERRDGGFDQHAAIKRLKRGMDSDEILLRFLQERQILASLAHPNIARLLDGGIDASGRPYFVMEHVEGAPITDWARDHGLSLRERVALLRKVCDAVAYAQRRLVVHRDLKPSNILVDDQGEPHLLDFGIAKVLGDAPGAHETRTDLRVLSPAYAAPEQIQGGAISTATDVHALGVVLYELLTGELPFRRSRTAIAGTGASAEYDSLIRPSQLLRRLEPARVNKAWGDCAPEPVRLSRLVAGDLDRIVMTALRPEPERRYPSAAALTADLAAFLDGRPITARADSSSYRLRKFVLRHRLGVAATAAALIALIAGFGTALWQARLAHEQAGEADRQRELAERHLARAEAQARRAEETKKFVVELLKLSSPELSRNGMQTTAVDLIRDAAARVDALTDAADTQAELQIAIGSGLISLGATDEGVTRLENGIAQLRALGDAALPALANGLHQWAMYGTASGRLAEARQASEEALAIFDRLGDREDLALSRIATLTTLAKNTGFSGDVIAGKQLYERILAERSKLLGPDDPRLAVDWNNLGAVTLRLDRYAEAERAYVRASQLMALDPNAPESRQAWLQTGRMIALVGLGKFDAAESEGLGALAIAERTLHPNHSIVGSICTGLAMLYRHADRLPEAEAMANRARAIRTAINATELGPTEAQLGLVLLAQHRDGEALAVLNSAEHHFASQRNTEEPDYFMMRAAQALARVRTGELNATADIDAAIDALTQRHPGGNALIEALHLRAQAAAYLGDPESQRWRRRELEALEALLGPEHPRTRQARSQSFSPGH